MQKSNVKREKAFLIGVVLKGSSSAHILEQLEEMESLADTAGADIVGKATQSRNIPDPATFIGKGKTKTKNDGKAEHHGVMITYEKER